MEKLELSFSQLYEIERFNRMIDQSTSIAELKKLCKQLLQAWMMQKASCAWLMRQNLSTPPAVRGID